KPSVSAIPPLSRLRSPGPFTRDFFCQSFAKPSPRAQPPILTGNYPASTSMVLEMARCIYCREKAGWFKALCRDCKAMLQAIKELGSQFSFRTLLDALMEACPSNQKIERFLDADIGGQGSIRDIVTARMTNQLAHTMGQPTDMTSKKVNWI